LNCQITRHRYSFSFPTTQIAFTNKYYIYLETQTQTYEKPSGWIGPSGQLKKEIELQIFAGDNHCPGNMDKISRHSGISISLGMAKKK
jgi:hypothetical protein